MRRSTRWRTVGLIGVDTIDDPEDKRRIDDVWLRTPPVVVVMAKPNSRRRDHRLGWAEVRVMGGLIQAMLPWRWRKAIVSLSDIEAEYDEEGVLLIRGCVESVGLGGRSAWGKLP